MKTAKEFCTCGDKNCPLHPSNHDMGCDLCIQKNISLGEIPSCFFNQVGCAAEAPGYSYRDFAEMVIKKDKRQK